MQQKDIETRFTQSGIHEIGGGNVTLCLQRWTGLNVFCPSYVAYAFHTPRAPRASRLHSPCASRTPRAGSQLTKLSKQLFEAYCVKPDRGRKGQKACWLRR
jgi:hypothetical protein